MKETVWDRDRKRDRLRESDIEGKGERKRD